MLEEQKHESCNEKQKTLDLSSKKLQNLPLIKLTHLQYLYLENNNLKTLPQYIFIDAPLLKWLDVRNNQIERIPDSIENHPNIETMLLQNNRISYLPLALGTLNKLKYLQLSGNPIIYPKRCVVNSGIEYLLNYLKMEYRKQKWGNKNILDVSLSNDDIQITKYEENIAMKNKNDVNSSEDSILIETKKDDDKLINSKNRLFYKDLKKECKKKLCPIKNTDRYVKRVYKSNEEFDYVLHENLLKDNLMKSRRELLNKREKVLQDRRSLEALKNWRKNYSDYKLDTKKMYYALNLANIPYDTDLNYVKILTRADIEKDLPDKYKKNIRTKSKIPKAVKKDTKDMQTKINEIIDSMNSIRTENYEWSPRMEKKLISCEIKRLTNIKKQIDKLKSENNKG